ncbi:nucleotidyl transferase AbiEii/AbiGii toxin family protein [Zobellella denitrificans]
MDRQSHYYRQVQLLLRIIPSVARHDCFALKGGTAINLLVRDFPRLSVDINLVFLPMMERHEALQTIKKKSGYPGFQMAGRHHLRCDLSTTGRTIRNGGEPWTLKRPPFRFCSRPEPGRDHTLLMKFERVDRL